MLLRDAKVLVACERAAGSRHHHRARVRAARDDGCHVRIADHAELRRGDAIKRDLGCAGQSLSENFSGLIDLGARLNEGDERTKTGVKTIDGACKTICVRPVEHAVRPLQQRIILKKFATAATLVDRCVFARKTDLVDRAAGAGIALPAGAVNIPVRSRDQSSASANGSTFPPIDGLQCAVRIQAIDIAIAVLEQEGRAVEVAIAGLNHRRERVSACPVAESVDHRKAPTCGDVEYCATAIFEAVGVTQRDVGGSATESCSVQFSICGLDQADWVASIGEVEAVQRGQSAVRSDLEDRTAAVAGFSAAFGRRTEKVSARVLDQPCWSDAVWAAERVENGQRTAGCHLEDRSAACAAIRARNWLRRGK